MSRFILPFQSVYDLNGHPLDGAKLYFYETGTSTPKDTFSDEALSVANANPVIADNTGEFGEIFLDGVYRVELQDKDGVTQPNYPADSVPADAASTYATVAAMKSASIDAGAWVYTKGYYAAGDGGHATYFIKTLADAGTPDAYGDHALANGNVAVLQTDGGASIRVYGAKGDGTTDDRAAIQAALNAVSAVYVPPGTFVFNTSFSYTQDKQTIHGSGPKSVLESDTGSVYVQSAGYDDCVFRNIQLDGSAGTNGGILIQSGSIGFKVTDNLFVGGSQRVWLFACDSVSVSGNTFDATGYQVIQENGYVSSNCRVVDNTALNCTGDFVLLNCEDGSQSKNWVISANTVKNVGGTFDAESATEDRFVGATYVDGLIITNNVVDGVAGDSCIHLENPGKTHISNNIFRNARAPSLAARFIYLLADVETSAWYGPAVDVTITDNDFIVDNAVVSGSDVYIGATAVTQNGRLVIRGNNFIFYGADYPADPAAAAGTGVQISNFYGYAEICENQFRNLATGVSVNNNKKGSPATERRPNIVGNVFENCDLGVTSLADGYIHQVNGNKFAACTESFVFINPPRSITDNQFINTVSNGWATIALGTARGNTFENSTTDCPVEGVEQFVADTASIALGALSGDAIGIVTVYARRDGSSSYSSECFQILHRAGVLTVQSIASRLIVGTGTATFTLSISAGQLLVRVDDSGATGSSYKLYAAFMAAVAYTDL